MQDWEALLEELILTRRPALVGYACVLTGSVAEAEDVVHDALIRTFVKPRGLRDIAHAEAYVRRAIVTTFLNSRRSHRRLMQRLHLFAEPDPVADAQAHVADADALSTALQTLSPRERACVVLRHFEQLRVAEIADALGVSEGSVKRYLSDGMRKLAGQLGPLRGLEDADARERTAVVEGRRR